MMVKIWKIPFGYLSTPHLPIPFEIKEKGYIEMDVFDADKAWHLCNWSCWTEEKPGNLHSDLEVANSDVIFHDPSTDMFYIALPFGWKVINSIDNVIEFCITERLELASIYRL